MVRIRSTFGAALVAMGTSPLAIVPMKKILGALVLMGWLAGPVRAADVQWTRVASPHLTLYTAGPAAQAREWLLKAEACRQFIAGLGPSDERALEPFTGALYRDEPHFEEFFTPPADRTLVNRYTISYRVGSRTMVRDGSWWAAINSGQRALAEPAFFLFVGEWASTPFPRPLPEWLARGLGELCVQAAAKGDRFAFGGRFKPDLDVLDGKFLAPVDSLLQPNLPHGDMPSAQSWLLVHYLLWGDGGANRPALVRFVKAWEAGSDWQAAAAAAFPAGLEDLRVKVQRYLKQGKFDGELVTLTLPPTAIEVRPTTELESEVLLGYMRMVADTPELASDHLDHAWRLGPRAPAVLEAKAMLARMQRQQGEAEDYFRQACAAGSTWRYAHAVRVMGLVQPLAGADAAFEGVEPAKARQAADAVRDLLQRGPYGYAPYEWYAMLIGSLPSITPEDEAVLAQGKKLYPNEAGLDLGLMAVHLRRNEAEAARAIFTRLQERKTPIAKNLEGFATRLWLHFEASGKFETLKQQYADGQIEAATATFQTLVVGPLTKEEKTAVEEIREVLENTMRAREAMKQKLYGSATGYVSQGLRDNPPPKIRAALEALQAEIAAARQAAQAAPK